MGNGFSQTNKALSLYNKGKHSEARRTALRVVKREPSNATAWNLIGIIASSLEENKEAKAAFSELSNLRPDMSIVWANLARACFQLGELQQALRSIRRAIDTEPQQAAYYDILIVAAAEFDQSADDSLNFGIQNVLSALDARPNDAKLLIALHKLWVAKGDVVQAINSALLAIASDPNNMPLKVSFAGFLFRNGRVSEAAKLYAEIVAEDPSSHEGWLGFGACHHDMASHDIAKEAYEKALDINPDCIGANKNFGTLLAYGRQFEKAIYHLERVVALDPELAGPQLQLLNYRRNICDWTVSDASLRDRLMDYEATDVSPFQALPLFDCPELQNHLGKHWRSNVRNKRAKLGHRSKANSKIRVGWFSNDFHDHATMFLLAGVFREYDRSNFEYFVYSYGAHTSGDYRERLISQVDSFKCFARQNDEKIIKAAREDELDIAIDLKGYTNGGRYHLFAQGVAPVQISYLGYPGTSGTSHFDYLIADHVVIPSEQRGHYSEQIMYMPHCYQPNDSERLISSKTYCREDMGLPSEGLVFASFNQAYKVSREEFDVWAELLKDFENSVLWLYVVNESARRNLKKELEKRGVSGDRLFFADQLPNSEHLARCRLADVFLDCFNVNAHTTASDALWAGVPVVTMPGNQFAARVAASILEAANLSELVARTKTEYLEIARRLASQSQYRLHIAQKLSEARISSPLFDTKSYVSDFERLLKNAAQASMNGRPAIDLT